MTVYLVILEDRHTDVQAEVFADREGALKRAAEIVDEYGYDTDQDTSGTDWLFDAALSGEGDYVRVEEAEVQ